MTLAAAVSGQFQVKSQSALVAEVGSDAVLPCTLSPPLSLLGLEVRWFRTLYHSVVVLLKDGREEKEQQVTEYRGRASLRGCPEVGDLGLSLRNIRLSDAGIYHCFVENTSSQIYEEAILQLNVTGVGSLPNLTVSVAGNSLMLSLSTSGWYPEPEVYWEGTDGNRITPGSEISTKETDGHFRLESSILLKDSLEGNLYCAVRNAMTLNDTGFYIRIADSLFPRQSKWLYAFVFVFLVCLMGGFGAFYVIRRLQNEKDALTVEVGRLSAEIDWRKAVMKPENIRFSPETTQPNLSVSEDCMTLFNQPPDVEPDSNNARFETERCCLGTPSFSSGCHYWEVDVGTGPEWAVGVASPKIRRQGAYQFSPQEHIWCIANFVNTYKVLDTPEKPLNFQRGTLNMVGVYLKLKGPWELSFYDVHSWECIAKFSVTRQESLSPFFWLGNTGEKIRLIETNRGKATEGEEREKEETKKRNEEPGEQQKEDTECLLHLESSSCSSPGSTHNLNGGGVL
ncbi:butyrophilin subfamily 1 member A1-like [Spea bombifrons]|uniref:butyrophilin subfamily 1 member A1-like n=1 Tax=Spea bombifrons TaxID=233779 RepID=UPI00234A3C88|nr:butyrophilin subfamily 1 member A1-like [Spea bombifrons]